MIIDNKMIFVNLLLPTELLTPIISALSAVILTLLGVYFNKKKNTAETKNLDAQSQSIALNDMVLINESQERLRKYFEDRYTDLLEKYDNLHTLIGKKVGRDIYLLVVEERDTLLRISDEQKITIKKLERDVNNLKTQVKTLMNKKYLK